jgi:wyosine [tRNA(Phe)-imidazoG37] synthetase (radical SAM superfamily)
MPDATLPQHTRHPRAWEQNRFVYPVLSRRSKGLSIGVNLNPDKVCNFDCVYCQVDRRSEAETRFVELDGLMSELDAMLALVSRGEIWGDPEFADVPEELRRLNDIAFSGDGEPTTYRNFDEIIDRVAALKRRWRLGDVKLVLITNASMFHRNVVQHGLELLDRNQGEIWAKLETGTEAYYELIERTRVPFRQILQNITAAALVRPIVIQSMFLRLDGQPPPSTEIDAYVDRLKDILAAGGRIKLVQVYTVARPPAESSVGPLTHDEVDAIAQSVRERTGVPTESYYGA